MEPVTHILTGACLARAGLNRRAAYATATMAIAAEFPDIDTLWGYIGGPVVGFQHHRGFTHTFLGLPIEAGLIVAGVYAVHRIRQRRAGSVPPKAPVRWGVLYGFALIALLSHIFLDFTNNYGVRPLSPFNPRWYAGSFVFIFDPVLFCLLLMAFLLPPLFALIGSEVGSRRPAFRGRGWAIASLLLIACWWSVRFVEHHKAVTLAEAQSRVVSADGSPRAFALPNRVLANPDPLSIFRWHIVSDFGGFYQLAETDTLNGSLTPAQDIYPKPAITPVIAAAAAAPLGRAYLDWSPVPMLSVSLPGDPARAPSDDPDVASATIVTFRDPRFMGDIPFLRSRSPLTGTVLLNQRNRVIGQTMDGKAQR